jgi:hypothetical protein
MICGYDSLHTDDKSLNNALSNLMRAREWQSYYKGMNSI